MIIIRCSLNHLKTNEVRFCLHGLHSYEKCFHLHLHCCYLHFSVSFHYRRFVLNFSTSLYVCLLYTIRFFLTKRMFHLYWLYHRST
ncbi:hypothetical protein HanIR_Chr17g0872721 [Helianthus annuus]|nr:hypothetical protein HanIR_Chr17g0872721 [Helianthus annuus]